MNTGPRFRVRAPVIVTALVVSLAAAGCASVMPRQAVEPEPAACTDRALVQLRAEAPDSLADRERQRLQSLERDCALARAAAARDTRGATHQHHMWWVGSGLAMALMMVMMWSPW